MPGGSEVIRNATNGLLLAARKQIPIKDLDDPEWAIALVAAGRCD
jgi:hypothetical protein